jgi:hypothetical protein
VHLWRLRLLLLLLLRAHEGAFARVVEGAGEDAADGRGCFEGVEDEGVHCGFSLSVKMVLLN